ncbi:hypothetical protein AAN93_000139 [Salmonella enterica subsp. enterica]|uniref:Uncharacterized protein n=1 Tax=Salmonella enterica TaxID=28901 RepID=A0A7D8IP82_SALER|nr:hypothetical protein [Salmonella enterica subsp. enterica serovar Amherstiana]SUF93423.1 Uncharacterised protein [Salmonella enterica]
MENPHCNSVDYANGIPTSHYWPDQVKNKKGRAVKAFAKGKTTYITIGAEE